MATYEEIYGKRVKEFDSDPTLESSYEGQVWYDKSTGVLKSVISFGAWRSGGNLTVPRSLGGISGGTQTASLAYAGYLGGPGNSNSTEEYNGTGWGSGGNVNTARRGGAGLGIQTAALLAGGYSTTPTTFVEEYDGSSWSEVTNTPADMSAGAGTQTAALVFNGTTALYYDGTNWTSSTALPTAMVGGTGLQTAALAVIPPPSGTTTLEWDGSSWTTGGSYNTARPSGLGGMTSGIQTSAISAGTPSSPPPTRVGPITEQYDGTSWATSSGTQGTARHTYMTSAANNTAALIAGGSPYTTATEEFDQSINTITPAAWSSTTNLPAAIFGAQGAGTPNAALVFGGFGPSARTDSYKWDGSSWTSAGTVPTGQYFASSGGTQTAAFGAGGYGPSPSKISTTHEYDGSSWSTGGAYPGSIANFAGCGTQTAGLAFGGNPDPNGTSTNHYNGSTWTSSGAMSQNRDGHMSVGIQTAALAIGGYPQLTVVEQYNGSSWTSSPGSLVTAVNNSGSAEQGSTSDAFIFGGNYASTPEGFSARTQRWDGTTWRTDANLGTGRREMTQGIGTTGAALAAGGTAPPNTAAVEEFSPETSTVTSQTLTTS